MGQALNIPALPEGFMLESHPKIDAGSLPPLPEGFALESEPKVELGFLSRMNKDMKTAGGKLANTMQSNDPTIAKGVEIIGTEMAAAGNTVANVAGSGIRYAGDVVQAIVPETYDAVGKKVQQAAQYVADSKVGRAAKKGEEQASKFAENNPQGARLLGAANDIVSNVPLLKAGEVAVKAGAKGLEGVADVAAQGVKGLDSSITTKARSADQAAQDVGILRNEASQNFDKVTKEGATFKPAVKSKVIANVESTLAKGGELNKIDHPKTFSKLEQFTQDVERGNLTLNKLDKWRKAFSETANDKSNIVNGAQTADAYMANRISKGIVKTIDEIGDKDLLSGNIDTLNTLNTAKAQWSKALAFERVADILKKADGSPDKIKSGLKRFMDKPHNTKGFTSEEMALLKRASHSGRADKLVKGASKLGVGGNNISPLLQIGIGAAQGSAAGIVPVAAGTAVKYGRELNVKGQGEQLLRAIEKRPLPKAIERAPNVPEPKFKGYSGDTLAKMFPEVKGVFKKDLKYTPEQLKQMFPEVNKVEGISPATQKRLSKLVYSKTGKDK